MEKSKNHSIRLMLLLLIALSLLSACQNQQNAQQQEEQPMQEETPKTASSLQETCKRHGGIWISQAYECEGISQEQCTAMGGKYNECASACRNNPQAQMCTLQCVVVCSFS
ncbi:MAG: hypothetical protein QW594_02915 [Candidatus Woesearchaeota archaeon]